MNPDFDDYDDVTNERDEETRPRTLPRLVLGLAIVGFLALAIYAYRSGNEAVKPGDLTTIEADLGAIKERPANPEGEEFPNKDKTIYDAISPSEGGTKVEKLLPESEEPVKPTGTTETTTDSKTWVNDAIKEEDKTTTVAPEDAVKAAIADGEKKATETKPVEPATAAPVKKVEAAKIEPVTTTEPAKTEPLKTATAEPIKTTSGAAVETKVAETKPAEKAKTVEKPATTTASGNYKIQLGAYKSEQEANDTWKKIIAKNSDILSGKPQSVVKADTATGTFYRLRVGGYASADAAKAACTKLSARKQGCFFAGR